MIPMARCRGSIGFLEGKVTMGAFQMEMAEARLSPCLASFPAFLAESQSNFNVENVWLESRAAIPFFAGRAKKGLGLLSKLPVTPGSELRE